MQNELFVYNSGATTGGSIGREGARALHSHRIFPTEIENSISDALIFVYFLSMQKSSTNAKVFCNLK